MSEEPKTPSPAHASLSFDFTPVDPPRPEDATQNPHAKDTTFVPNVVVALEEQFSDDVLEVTLYANEHTVRVSRDRIVEIGRFLKEKHGFSYFVDLSAVDRFTDDERFEVYYNLVNIDDRKRIRLKVRTEEDHPHVPSVTGVWRAANWQERECYDMFGIIFDGHPDLRRMYMPEDFEYYPLRKEFPLLGIPGSLPLPPQDPEGDLTRDPYPAAHGSKPVKSYQESESDLKNA